MTGSTIESKTAGISYTIVHVLPGRVRLRIDALRNAPELADQFVNSFASQAGIISVRANTWNGNAVIEFDPMVLTLGEAFQNLDHSGLPINLSDVAAVPRESWTDKLCQCIESLAPPVVQLAVGATAFVAAVLEFPAVFTNILLAAAAVPVMGRALNTLASEKRLGVDALDGIASVIMISQRNYGAAGFMLGLISLGEFIREKTERQCREILSDLLGMTGRSAWIVRGKKRICVPADQVNVGDTVVVYTGEMVPVDGTVIDGEAAIDTSTLTGESLPAEVQEGSKVFASTVLVEGKVYVKCEAVGSQTRAGMVLDMVNAAPVHETKLQNYAARVADRLVVPILLGSCACFLATSNVTRMLSMLIFDFATGIRIAAPTAVLASMERAGRRGILIKTGAALERLASVDAILFDKTGTLTLGEPHVTEVVALNGVPGDRVLCLAAAVEQRSHHPAARAIVRHAQHAGLLIPERLESAHLLGMGAQAQVEQFKVLVGNHRLMETEGVPIASAEAKHTEISGRGESLSYVAIDGQLAGIIAYTDRLRPEAHMVVSKLKRLGVKEIVMATGDNPAPANTVARQVGIDRVLSRAFPEEKAKIVQELKHKGYTVAVVGDGINDSPALAHADVAISLHGGTDAARAGADVVLTDDDLRRLPEAIAIARGAMGLVQETIALVAVPNGAGIGLAAFGLIGPAFATLLNNGSAIVAALNSLRPLYTDSLPPAEPAAAGKAPRLIQSQPA